MPTNLDTVIINTDDNTVTLLWRGYLAVRNGPLEATSIRIQTGGLFHEAVN